MPLGNFSIVSEKSNYQSYSITLQLFIFKIVVKLSKPSEHTMITWLLTLLNGILVVLQIINTKNINDQHVSVYNNLIPPKYRIFLRARLSSHVLTPPADMTCSKANHWKRKITLRNMIRASYVDCGKTFGVFTSKSQIKVNFHSCIR